MEPRYNFGLNPTYDPLRPDNGFSLLYEAPYSEHRELVLKGVILEPAKLGSKILEARLAGRADFDSKIVKENLQRYEDSPPWSVTAFLKQTSPILAYLSVPDDAFALAVQVAAAHKINLMRLRGQQLRYGRGYIHGYDLREEQETDRIEGEDEPYNNAAG